MRHHYIPEFYLKTWHVEKNGNFFLYMRDPIGNLKVRPRSASSVGYRDDLYSMVPDGLLALSQKDDSMETSFFQTIDNEAAKVHRKLISNGIKSLTEDDRDIWSKFIESLLERTPKRIDEVVSNSENEIENEIENIRKNFQLTDYSEIANKLISGSNLKQAIRNGVLWAMQKSIEEGDLAKGVGKFEWLTVDHVNKTEHFLTSDNPLLINNGKGKSQIFCLSIAISPTRLLIMMLKCPEFDREFVLTLAMTHSIHMCNQAEKYLISSRCLNKADFTNYESAASALFRVQKDQ